MKIIFKVIKAGSGNDVYFERLHTALKKEHIQSVIEYYPQYFQYFPFLLKFFNKKTPGDIIHSNVEYGWIFKEKDTPLIVTLHHNVFDKTFQSISSPLQKLFYSFILKPNIKKSLHRATSCIAVSNFTKKSFIKTFGNYPITVIYNFIDTNKYRPKNTSSSYKKFKLLFVGNLLKRKGADLLPKIMSELGETHMLYYTTGLRTKIPHDFLLPNMKALGKLSEAELLKQYNVCDVLLFPTRLEGFGYAVIEAMACGKPIIATNISSIPELVKTGENGYLCESGNIEDFVEKIKKLQINKTLRKIISLHNRKKIIEYFSENIRIKEYKNVYKNIL